MRIGNLNIEGFLFLAPLAGISNRPFRILARRYGADLCYTEMISADGLARNQTKTIAMIDIGPEEHPVGIQLFGASPDIMAAAARMAANFHADLIDINLGCPVKKVVAQNGGAALLKNLNLASEIMCAAVENSPLPVTIKMRTGWGNDSDDYLKIAWEAEKCGVSAITLHPRSRAAGFAGKSDWSKIGELKRAVSIPVIGNGDINTPQDAKAMLSQTGCDAIMIGRAAIRNLHIFRQCREFIADGTIISDLTPTEKIEMALEHSRLMIERFGERSGTLKMRKHLAWYSKGFVGGAGLRSRLNSIAGYNDIQRLFMDFLYPSGNS
jgi:nifR3 family TIM-barrel protein